MALTTTAAAIALLACHDLTLPLRHLLAPDTGAKYLNGAGTVVVYPGNMHGWSFYAHNTHTTCADTTCTMVAGPTGQPLGSGSAQLRTTSGADSRSLMITDYQGVRFADITQLGYWSYRQGGAGKPIYLQVNVDYDLNDSDVSQTSRLNYEPGLGSGEIPNATWQQWNATTGTFWWNDAPTVIKGGVSVTNPCKQTTPCSWTTLLQNFPNLGLHGTAGALYLRAGWTQYKGNVDAFSIGINGATTMFDFELASPSLVPATAPRGTPQVIRDSIYAASNILDNPPGVQGKVTRNTLIVRFTMGATVAEKTAALAGVNAEVIGGFYLTQPDGFYHVRIGSAIATPPDSVSGPLLRARATLRQSAVVRAVVLDRVDSPIEVMFRRPNDGVGFKNWRLSPDSADGDNWHLEGVNAPFAWGCGVGGSSVSVAVVDRWFKHAPDLDANVTGTAEYFAPAFGAGQFEHGTFVAGVLAARGNNGSAATGIAYEQKISLYDADLPDTAAKDPSHYPLYGIYRASKSHTIVNVSLGRPQRGTPTALDFETAHEIAEFMTSAVSPTTLTVVAAGNDGVDAILSAYPDITDATSASSVIVVGGTQLGAGGTQVPLDRVVGGIRIRTNTGVKVEIAAPADLITIGAGDALSRGVGTSLAAPLVSGAAALLSEFDPSLTAPELKDLLIQGAVLGGRYITDPANSAHQIPILNVYASLKLAARRRGTPLCGNRVHSLANGDVVAERAPGVDEVLFRSISGTPYTDLLNVLHGGRRIQIGDYLEFSWKPTNPTASKWAAIPIAGNYHEYAGGAFLSWYDGTEHDGHTYALASGGPSGAGNTSIVVDLYPNDPAGIRKTLTSQLFPFTQVTSDVCSRTLDDAQGNYNPSSCPPQDLVGSGWIESTQNARVAFAPQGNFVLLGVNRRYAEQYIDPPILPCSFIPVGGSVNQNGHCAYYRPARDSSVSVELWLVDTSGTRSWQQLKVTPASTARSGLNVSWLAIDETGTEIVWELGKDLHDGQTYTCTQRVIEYLALPGHPTVQPGGTTRPSIALPDDACSRKFGQATFSPYRASNGGTSKEAEAARNKPAVRRQALFPH